MVSIVSIEQKVIYYNYCEKSNEHNLLHNDVVFKSERITLQ